VCLSVKSPIDCCDYTEFVSNYLISKCNLSRCNGIKWCYSCNWCSNSAARCWSK